VTDHNTAVEVLRGIALAAAPRIAGQDAVHSELEDGADVLTVRVFVGPK
jgi:hypothetical protein